jgi:methyl-accepting chemotaxis protein
VDRHVGFVGIPSGLLVLSSVAVSCVALSLFRDRRGGLPARRRTDPGPSHVILSLFPGERGAAVRQKRKKIWIDRFQTTLCVRIAFYFILYQVAVWSLIVIERNIYNVLEAVQGPEVAARCFLFLGGAIVVLGLLFLYDALKLAHRLVGPLYRFRQALKAVAEGDEVELMRLRQGDYLHELKDDFNDMLTALEQRGAVVLKKNNAEQATDLTVPV